MQYRCAWCIAKIVKSCHHSKWWHHYLYSVIFTPVPIAIPSPLQKLNDPLITKSGIKLWIKREDLIHQEVSGNKWRKLKYNILEAKKQGKKQLLTFGGAFSNHIYATAAAGKMFDIGTIGVIRGEDDPQNPTLDFARQAGMKLHFISREQYRDKGHARFLQLLADQFGDFYLVPEGGTNVLALKGCAEIIDEIDLEFDYICMACGTGGTLAGLLVGLDGVKNTIGFSALKGHHDWAKAIDSLTGDYNQRTHSNYQIFNEYHFGGYGKFTPELADFIREFRDRNGMQLEPIYSGKMIYGLYDLILNGFFPKASRIVALHTGGLQGLKGLVKYRGYPI